MNSAQRRAWTEIVTAQDYDAHMAEIGQAQAAAQLTGYLIESAKLRPGSRISIVGAGTGQLLEFLDAGALRPYRLTFSDLNPRFLEMLRQRLARHGLSGTVVEDDFEESKLEGHPDLLLASLLFEHIDWHRGAETVARLAPAVCGIVLQENPPGMASAVTPGRVVPPSIAAAARIAPGGLVPRQRLVASMATLGYPCCDSARREVADAKRLVALLFTRRADGWAERSRTSSSGSSSPAVQPR